MRLAMLRANFVGIYPFIDGNGRTSRLQLNLILMKSGFPSSIIRVENSLADYTALVKEYTTQDYADFAELVTKEVESLLDLYLTVI